MIPSGVARPSAHGQAMIRTATAAVKASLTASPSTNHAIRYNDGSNPLRSSWRLVEGDLLRRMSGAYEFLEVEGNPEASLVVYDLDVDLLIGLPGFVKRRLEAKVVHAAIDDLKARIEADAPAT